MLCTAHALEQEFELQDHRAAQLSVNNSTHSSKIIKPALTRWQHAGKALVKFLKCKEKHIEFAKKVKDACKTGNSECNISSNFLSLNKEKVLVTMACFLEGF